VIAANGSGIYPDLPQDGVTGYCKPSWSMNALVNPALNYVQTNPPLLTFLVSNENRRAVAQPAPVFHSPPE
jgi:hypothetical protein